MVVLAMVFHVIPLSIDDSQRTTFPVFPLKVMVPLLALAHTVVLELAVPPTVSGSSTTVEFTVAPLQPFATGVIAKVTVIAAEVELVKAPLILPVPLAAIPVTVTVLFLTQLNDVAATDPLISIGKIAAPAQIFCVKTEATAVGAGLTIIVTITGVPAHPFILGVMVNVTNTGLMVVLVNTPFITAPLPLLLIPVTADTLSLVQVKIAPVVVLDKAMGAIELAEQIVWLGSDTSNTGFGFIITVDITEIPVQPAVVAVTVNNTVCI